RTAVRSNPSEALSRRPLGRRLERALASKAKRGHKAVECISERGDGPAVSKHPRVALHPALVAPESHHQRRLCSQARQLAVHHQAALKTAAAAALERTPQPLDPPSNLLLVLTIARA